MKLSNKELAKGMVFVQIVGKLKKMCRAPFLLLSQSSRNLEDCSITMGWTATVQREFWEAVGRFDGSYKQS